MKPAPEKRGVVALNFPSQIPFHCITTGISPLALRNDMKHTYFRNEVIRSLIKGEPLRNPRWSIAIRGQLVEIFRFEVKKPNTWLGVDFS